MVLGCLIRAPHPSACVQGPYVSHSHQLPHLLGAVDGALGLALEADSER